MADYDLFDLTSLSFDPPEKAPKKVIAAIDKVKKELNVALGTATQQIERDEINGKLSFLESKSKTIFSNDGKLLPVFEELANARIKKEIDNLTATVTLLGKSGSRFYTDGTIRIHKQKTKLSKEHIEEVFKTAGFKRSEIDPLKAFPKFPTNADKIYTELEALRKSKDPNPNAADLTKATDLYAFVAYLAGEPENAAAYRSKSTKTTEDLKKLLDDFAKTFATRNDDLGKLCASLATAGKSYVFNSEENRDAYDAYLKYKSPVLTHVFTVMKGATESNRSDPKFADMCIDQISSVFGNYEVSLAIYNKEAGLKDEPYIPEKAIFHVKCHYCQNVIEFSDITEAQKVNKCTHCGKPLYKQCKKCNKSVLESLDKCPECGFLFSGAAMFIKHYTAAEQALRKSDFESAHNFLFQAKMADPAEKSKIDELAARIETEEKRYEKPRNDLRKLIAEKTFQKASDELAAVISKFPALNVSEFETQIKSVLFKAQAAFENAKKLSSSRQADECLAILQYCADFKPAISYLQTAKPEICRDITISTDSLLGNASISWTRSSEQGISYRLIRKQGNVIPVNELDGEVLVNNTSETSYLDKSIMSGYHYGYAVFAMRHEVFSSAMGKTILLLADVSDAHVEQLGAAVRLSWNKPKNCLGVTVRRTQNGAETVLTNNAQSSFDDKDTQYGVTYSYKLCANYNNQAVSRGVDLPPITPSPKIDSFSITATAVTKQAQAKEKIYKVSWNINTPGIDLQISVNEKTVCRLKSDQGSCDLELPPEGFYNITAMALSGGKWMNSENSQQLNTYSPCLIDEKASAYYEESGLHLKVDGVIPANVVGFYYAVRTADSPKRFLETLETEDVNASSINRISTEAYRQNGEIRYEKMSRDESAYYVSLFTIYNTGGKEVVSNSKRRRFDRPLNTNVTWKLSKNLLGALKLTVEFSGDRSFGRIPELVLCAGYKHLLSHDDAHAEHLLKIPAVNLESPQKTCKNSYDLNSGISARQLKDKKIFLFEVSPALGEKFTLRWAEGFTGKI